MSHLAPAHFRPSSMAICNTMQRKSHVLNRKERKYEITLSRSAFSKKCQCEAQHSPKVIDTGNRSYENAPWSVRAPSRPRSLPETRRRRVKRIKPYHSQRSYTVTLFRFREKKTGNGFINATVGLAVQERNIVGCHRQKKHPCSHRIYHSGASVAKTTPNMSL